MNVTSIADQQLNGTVARLRREMRQAETTLDEALLASSKLMQTMIDARRAHATAPHTGQKAIIRLVRAQQAIVNGANDVFRVHDELNATGREMGIMDEHKTGFLVPDDLDAQRTA